MYKENITPPNTQSGENSQRGHNNTSTPDSTPRSFFQVARLTRKELFSLPPQELQSIVWEARRTVEELNSAIKFNEPTPPDMFLKAAAAQEIVSRYNAVKARRGERDPNSTKYIHPKSKSAPRPKRAQRFHGKRKK